MVRGMGMPEATWMPKQEINPENWFTTAPTAEQEPQQDTTKMCDVHYSPEGIACCAGVKGD